MKIRLAGAELCHADGRTDSHDEANSRFLPFGERSYKFYVSPTECIAEIFLSILQRTAFVAVRH